MYTRLFRRVRGGCAQVSPEVCVARLVLKFGGTSVGAIDRIKNVARRVKAVYDAGNEVAVVVSAMSGQTNHLVKLVDEISQSGDRAECHRWR